MLLSLIPIVLKQFLGNGLSIFSIKSNPAFSNGPKSLPENLPDCPILSNWVFDNLY